MSRIAFFKYLEKLFDDVFGLVSTGVARDNDDVDIRPILDAALRTWANCGVAFVRAREEISYANIFVALMPC